MKKILFSIIEIIYLVISILMTSYLLNYNDYNIAEYGKTTYVTLDKQLGEYKEGSLLKITKDIGNIKAGDGIFYYDTFNTSMKVSYTKVTSVNKVNDNEYTYTMENGSMISSSYVIGGTAQTKSYGIGKIVDFLASRWGYLLIIVLPILIVFIYELYALVRELLPKKGQKVNKAKKEVQNEKTQEE